MMVEQWRPIEWTDGWYEVSSLGRVRSWRVQFRSDRADEPRIMATGPCKRGGYPVVRIRVGRSGLHYVHRLVCEAFNGPAPRGADCRHLNGVETDNRPENLAWGTRTENMQDSVRLGRVHRGESHPGAKLTKAEVVEMRRLHGAGITQVDIARRFNVSSPHVCDIVNHKKWAWLE